MQANSKLKSSEYSIPVFGLIFLRYANQKFGADRKALEGKGTGHRQAGKADYQAKGQIKTFDYVFANTSLNDEPWCYGTRMRQHGRCLAATEAVR
jgi:hypothetical protein